MLRFFFRRLALLFAAMIVMSVLIFAATQSLPGDAAKQVLEMYGGSSLVRELRAQLGLDQPLWVQYGRWASGVLHGNLGVSMVYRQPVAKFVGPALVRSLLLIVFTMTLAIVLGVGIGLLVGLRRGSPLDSTLVALTSLAVSVPDFLLALLVILLFGIRLRWFPPFGAAPQGAGLAEVARHIVLPVLTLTLLVLPHVVRVTRSSVIDAMGTEYVRASMGRGLRRWTVVSKYVLRNAMGPTIAVMALDVGLLLGNAVVVESVFGYPGLGQLTVFAISYRDVPLVQACALVLVLVFGLSSLVGDLVTAHLNPRIREGLARQVPRRLRARLT